MSEWKNILNINGLKLRFRSSRSVPFSTFAKSSITDVVQGLVFIYIYISYIYIYVTVYTGASSLDFSGSFSQRVSYKRRRLPDHRSSFVDVVATRRNSHHRDVTPRSSKASLVDGLRFETDKSELVQVLGALFSPQNPGPVGNT